MLPSSRAKRAKTALQVQKIWHPGRWIKISRCPSWRMPGKISLFHEGNQWNLQMVP